MMEKDWSSLQELRIVGEGPSAVTVGVKKADFGDDERDRFNIDHNLAQNPSLPSPHISATASQLYKEYAMVNKMEKVMKQEGPIADLRKAIGELVLLQTLSSALRENTPKSSYTVKDTFSDDSYQSTIKLPLIQEIEIMQSINGSAKQFLEKRLELMRGTVQKRRVFERDLSMLLELCPQWTLEVAKQQTRLPADLPESGHFSMDKDALALHCYWRPRPRIFHDPYYFAYLRMNTETGHVELNPTLRNISIDNVALTLQISLQNVSNHQQIASLDLWQLMNASSPTGHLRKRADAAHVVDVINFCTALSHTSLAREVFYHLTEEVGKATSIVSMAGGAAGAAVEVAKDGAPEYVKLAEQFSLCEQSNRVLRWQIADSLVLSITLVHLDTARLHENATDRSGTDVSASASTAAAAAAMQVDDDDQEQHEQRIDDHWQQVITFTLATLLGTFHTSVAIQRKSEELDKQWRHRSQEAEQQIVSRRTAPAEPKMSDPSRDLLSPQSMLVDAFKTLRIQHQYQHLRRLLHPVHGSVPQKLISAGFVSNTDGVRLHEAFTSLPDESTTHAASSSMKISQQRQALLSWWRRHIAPLLSFSLTATYSVRLPVAASPVPPSNPSSSIVIRPLSAGALDKDLVQVAFAPDDASAEEDVRGDVVTMGNVARAVWQHVLQYTLRWLLTHRWASVASTQWGYVCRPSVFRSVYSFGKEPTASAALEGTTTSSMALTQMGEIGLAMLQRRATATAAEETQVVVTLVSTDSSLSSASMAKQLLQAPTAAASYHSDFDVLVGTLPTPSAPQTVTIVPWSALL